MTIAFHDQVLVAGCRQKFDHFEALTTTVFGYVLKKLWQAEGAEPPECSLDRPGNEIAMTF